MEFEKGINYTGVIIELSQIRLIILDNHQMEGINYTKTFAPLVKLVITHYLNSSSIERMVTLADRCSQCVSTW